MIRVVKPFGKLFCTGIKQKNAKMMKSIKNGVLRVSRFFCKPKMARKIIAEGKFSGKKSAGKRIFFCAIIKS